MYVLVLPYQEPNECGEGAGDTDEVRQLQAEVEAVLVDAEVGHADGHHEHARYDGYEVGFVAFGQIDGDGEEGEDGEGLVEPCEVTPQDVELDKQQHDADGKHGQTEHEALDDLILLDLEHVGQYETCAAQGGVAGGDGGDDNAEDGEDGTERSEPTVADLVDEDGRVDDSVFVEHGVVDFFIGGAAGHIQFVGKLQGGCRPYQGDDALGDHGTVEHAASLALVLDAAGHHRALCGVESADRSTGNGDAQAGEDGQSAAGVVVLEGIGNLGYRCTAMGKYTDEDADGHENKDYTEHGVYLADNLVDGQGGGQEVVEKDHHDPEEVGVVGYKSVGHIGQQSGRRLDEHGHHKYHQEEGEVALRTACDAAHLVADNLGQGGSVAFQRDHGRHVVVRCSAEDTTQHDPEVG